MSDNSKVGLTLASVEHFAVLMMMARLAERVALLSARDQADIADWITAFDAEVMKDIEATLPKSDPKAFEATREQAKQVVRFVTARMGVPTNG
jgi:hypothetical protein